MAPGFSQDGIDRFVEALTSKPATATSVAELAAFITFLESHILDRRMKLNDRETALNLLITVINYFKLTPEKQIKAFCDAHVSEFDTATGGKADTAALMM